MFDEISDRNKLMRPNNCDYFKLHWQSYCFCCSSLLKGDNQHV